MKASDSQIVDCVNPVFILLDPLSSAVLRQIIRICQMLGLKCALIYTTVAAVVNSAALGLSLDGPDYPNTSLAVNSPGVEIMHFPYEGFSVGIPMYENSQIVA